MPTHERYCSSCFDVVCIFVLFCILFQVFPCPPRRWFYTCHPSWWAWEHCDRTLCLAILSPSDLAGFVVEWALAILAAFLISNHFSYFFNVVAKQCTTQVKLNNGWSSSGIGTVLKNHGSCMAPAAFLTFKPQSTVPHLIVQILQWFRMIWCLLLSFTFCQWFWDRFALFVCNAAGHDVQQKHQSGKARDWQTQRPTWELAMQSWKRAHRENMVDFRVQMVKDHPPLSLPTCLPRGTACTKIQPAVEWNAQKKSRCVASASNDARRFALEKKQHIGVSWVCGWDGFSSARGQEVWKLLETVGNHSQPFKTMSNRTKPY